MVANLDIDLESGLASVSQKIQHPLAAVVHEGPSVRAKLTGERPPIPPRWISKTGMPVISAGKHNIFVVLISPYPTVDA
jgi:hypothetical protein